jgi:hypothetical protein
MPVKWSVLELGGDKDFFLYISLINGLHNLKAVVRAVKLSVVVARGMYHAICNNYRINEN